MVCAPWLGVAKGAGGSLGRSQDRFDGARRDRLPSVSLGWLIPPRARQSDGADILRDVASSPVLSAVCAGAAFVDAIAHPFRCEVPASFYQHK